MTHATELEAYAAGTLTGAAAAEVSRHLAVCDSCAAEAAAWEATATAFRAEAAAIVLPSSLFAAVAAQLSPARYRVPPRRPVVAVWLVAAQLRILHKAVWPATALILALGVTLAATGGSIDLLGLIAPLVGALALAALPAPDADPVQELAAASGTSPRTLLLARLTVLSTWTAGLALLSSLVLTALDRSSDTLVTVVQSWLGPFALLSAVSVVGAVLWRPTAGVAAAVTLWGLRLLTRTPETGIWDPLGRFVDHWWTTDVTVLAVSALLTAGAILVAPSVNLLRLRRYSEA